MKQIYVDHPRIEHGAAQLAVHKKTFDEVLAQLESDLAPLVATWSGGARDLYVAKKQAWHAAAQDLTTLLGTIAKLTSDAHVGYVDTVSRVKDAWT